MVNIAKDEVLTNLNDGIESAIQAGIATHLAALSERALEVTNVTEFIQLKAPIALQLLADVIDGTLPAPIALRVKVASNWLDRAIGKPTTRVVFQGQSQQLSTEDIAAIKRRALLAKQEGSSELQLDSNVFLSRDSDIALNDKGEIVLVERSRSSSELEEELYELEDKYVNPEPAPDSDYQRWLDARGISSETEARNHMYFRILFENETKNAA